MTRFVFSNFAVSTLAESISAATTQLKVAADDVTRFPVLAGGTKFPLILTDSEDRAEIVYVTSLSSSGLATIERGQEGTTAYSWTAGTLLTHAFTAATVISAAGFRPAGVWSVNSSYSVGDVVEHEGISYVASVDSTGVPPSATATQWQVIYQPAEASGTALDWQGRWSSSTSYAAGQVVEYHGRLWRAASSNTNKVPIAEPNYWTPIANWAGAGWHNLVLQASSPNNYEVTIPAAQAPTELYDGLTILVRFAAANTGNPTLTIKRTGSTDLPAVPLTASAGLLPSGALIAGPIYCFTYRQATGQFVALQDPGAQAAVQTALGPINTTLAGYNNRITAVEGDMSTLLVTTIPGILTRITGTENTNVTQSGQINTLFTADTNLQASINSANAYTAQVDGELDTHIAANAAEHTTLQNNINTASSAAADARNNSISGVRLGAAVALAYSATANAGHVVTKAPYTTNNGGSTWPGEQRPIEVKYGASGAWGTIGQV